MLDLRVQPRRAEWNRHCQCPAAVKSQVLALRLRVFGRVSCGLYMYHHPHRHGALRSYHGHRARMSYVKILQSGSRASWLCTHVSLLPSSSPPKYGVYKTGVVLTLAITLIGKLSELTSCFNCKMVVLVVVNLERRPSPLRYGYRGDAELYVDSCAPRTDALLAVCRVTLVPPHRPFVYSIRSDACIPPSCHAEYPNAN